MFCNKAMLPFGSHQASLYRGLRQRRVRKLTRKLRSFSSWLLVPEVLWGVVSPTRHGDLVLWCSGAFHQTHIVASRTPSSYLVLRDKLRISSPATSYKTNSRDCFFISCHDRDSRADLLPSTPSPFFFRPSPHFGGGDLVLWCSGPLGPLGYECAQHRRTLRPTVDGIRSKALRLFGLQ